MNRLENPFWVSSVCRLAKFATAEASFDISKRHLKRTISMENRVAHIRGMPQLINDFQEPSHRLADINKPHNANALEIQAKKRTFS